MAVRKRLMHWLVAVAALLMCLGWLASVLSHAQPPGSSFRDIRLDERQPISPRGDEPVQSPIQAGRLWALVIGVNNYQSRNIPPLKFAVPDARAIRDRVVRRVPAASIREAYLENAAATKQHILDRLGDLANVGADDTVLVYFSMHGMAGKDGKDGYLMAYDSDPWNLETSAVPVNRILSTLGKASAKRLFLLIDACYSGAAIGSWAARAKTFTFGPTTRLGAGLSPDIYEAVRSRRGHFVMTASRPDEPSLELETLGQGHGLFTYFLIEGLEGAAARPGNSYVSITELYDYVSNRVLAFSQTLNVKQTPMMRGEFDGPPPLVTLVGPATGPRESDFGKLLREARRSFESSRLLVTSNGRDTIELLVAGTLHESWREPSRQIRIQKELFDRHGSPLSITLRASAAGRRAEEASFVLSKGDEREVAIETRRLPPPIFPLPPP